MASSGGQAVGHAASWCSLHSFRRFLQLCNKPEEVTPGNPQRNLIAPSSTRLTHGWHVLPVRWFSPGALVPFFMLLHVSKLAPGWVKLDEAGTVDGWMMFDTRETGFQWGRSL